MEQNLSVSEICDMAMDCFDIGNYHDCVEHLVEVYQQGQRQEEIMEFLYTNFVQPNEEEFQSVYNENTGSRSGILYDELELDFIPVSDKEFMIYDKEDKIFYGWFDLQKVKQVPLDDAFNGVLFGDIWDIGFVLQYAVDKIHQQFYLISNNIQKTASYFKIPGLWERFKNNVMVFADIEQCYRFFEEYPDEYLPKQIISGESKVQLENMLRRLHNKRIQDVERERKNILLSICIPSYNRGKVALENVKKLLHMSYDAEIEIIVSNNASTVMVEEYQQIAEMKDARLRYCELPPDPVPRFTFWRNIVQVLSMANGKYAVLCSDEDSLIVEKLSECLGFLRFQDLAGVICTGGLGKNMTEGTQNIMMFANPSEDVVAAGNLNYITGIIYRMEDVRQTRALECVKEWVHRGKSLVDGRTYNAYVLLYPHNLITMLVAKQSRICFMGITMWMEGEGVDNHGWTHGNDRPSGTQELNGELDRVYQYQALQEATLETLGLTSKEMLEFYYWHGSNIYRLLRVCQCHYEQYFREQGITRRSIWDEIHQRLQPELEKLQAHMIEEDWLELVKRLETYYLETRDENW